MFTFLKFHKFRHFYITTHAQNRRKYLDKKPTVSDYAPNISKMANVCKIGRGYFAGLRVTKRNKATVLLTLTLFQTPTLTPNPNPYPNPNLTLLQVCF